MNGSCGVFCGCISVLAFGFLVVFYSLDGWCLQRSKCLIKKSLYSVYFFKKILEDYSFLLLFPKS